MCIRDRIVWRTELEEEVPTFEQIKLYDKFDFNAPFASGSGQYTTMIIIPCSMGTPVSYTHLDVYKRQMYTRPLNISNLLNELDRK